MGALAVAVEDEAARHADRLLPQHMVNSFNPHLPPCPPALPHSRPPPAGALGSPSRWSRHAAPESATHDTAHSTGCVVRKNAAGTATQKLRQLKQSISPPIGLSP